MGYIERPVTWLHGECLIGQIFYFGSTSHENLDFVLCAMRLFLGALFSVIYIN